MQRKYNIEVLAIFWLFIIAGFLSICHSGNARDINWDELQEKAKKYTGGKAVQIPGQKGQNSVDLVIPSQPTSRPLFNDATPLSDKDNLYIRYHMKLANNNFAAKKYDRSIAEAELIFARQPEHPGARFMRAVIAARLKDHPAAWQNIIIAREKDPENPKIKSFIDKLKTAAPEPNPPSWVPGILRTIPVSASEKAADIIESFLNNTLSQNVVSITTGDFSQNGNSTWIPIDIESSAALNREQVIDALKKAASGKVEISENAGSNDKADDKKLSLKVEIPGFSVENKDVKPVSQLRDYIKSVTEDIDVAISDTMERDAENKILDTTYEVSTRDFKTLNDFLRTISPYAHKYRILSMKLAFIPGSQSIIWKCKVQVFFQLS